MIDDVFPIISYEIPTDAIASFVTEFGGVVPSDDPGEGWVLRGDCYLRVSFGRDEYSVIVLADALGGEKEEVTKKLGATPQHCIDIIFSRPPGSQVLAVDFAAAFAKRWHAVLIDVEHHVLDLANLQRLQREGKGFGSDFVPINQG